MRKPSPNMFYRLADDEVKGMDHLALQGDRREFCEDDLVGAVLKSPRCAGIMGMLAAAPAIHVEFHAARELIRRDVSNRIKMRLRLRRVLDHHNKKTPAFFRVGGGGRWMALRSASLDDLRQYIRVRRQVAQKNGLLADTAQEYVDELVATGKRYVGELFAV